jgi:prolyl oligopeptidase
VPAPRTRRDDDVEDLHGVAVPDPYRWLEDATAPEVRAWVEAQNAWTHQHLDALPARGAFAARLTELLDHPRRSVPWRRGAAWLQLRNDGRQDQDVLMTASADPLATGTPPLPDEDRWHVLLDPNTWSEDGTAALVNVSLTDDGALIAYARSDAGSDWMTWRIVDVGTGVDLGDEVRWAKFTGAAWLADGSGFVYGGYAPPAPGQEHLAATREHQLRLHRLGAADDPVVYARPDEPEWTFTPEVTHDGRWLVVTVAHGTRPETRIHAARIDERGEIGAVTPVIDDGTSAWTFLGVVGGRWWFLTDDGAERGRIVTLDPARPEVLDEVVPQGPDRIETATLVGAADGNTPGWLVVRTLHHATSRLMVHDLGGAVGGALDLPGLGTVMSLAGGRSDDAVFATFETFTAPLEVHRFDLPSGRRTPVHQPSLAGGADLPELVTAQVFVTHPGPTTLPGPVRVPVFLVHRADVAPTGAVPTVLWGYGGFDIPVTPMFRAGWRVWVERGGLFAVACLRGGGEYGRAWNEDGKLATKQHVFDDALAVAAWLTGADGADGAEAVTADGAPLRAGRPWTAPAHLGIEGGSNGGLLVGACLTQRPDRFGCGVAQVGVFDLLRFHRFTIGWAWTSDYGSPDDPEAFAWLTSWSPLHHVREGTAYPATLLATGDTDDRVVPGHSYKFAAALQAAQAGDAPILLRVDVAAGHGLGKPLSKTIAERADILAFEAHRLGLTEV